MLFYSLSLEKTVSKKPTYDKLKKETNTFIKVHAV